MSRSGFKNAILFRLKLLRATTIFSTKEGMAFVANNYSSIASTVVYVITYLVFLSAMFGRIDTIAGYSYAEVLFFTLVVQLGFFLSYTISVKNLDEMARMIRSGNLDLVLVKPVPLVWYLGFQKVDLRELIVQATTSVLPVTLLLTKNWNISLNVPNIILGLVIVLAGLVSVHCFQFILYMSVIFTGQWKGVSRLSYELAYFGDTIPFEGYPFWLKVVGMTIVPTLFHSALATAVMLGKIPAWPIVGYTCLVAMVFLWTKMGAWHKALSRYSSASS